MVEGDKAGVDADIAAAEQISPDIARNFERHGVGRKRSIWAQGSAANVKNRLLTISYSA